MSSNSSMPSPSNSPPFPVTRGFWGCFFGSSIGGICWGTSVQSPARRLGSRINAKLLTRVEMRSLAVHCQTRQGNARGRVQIHRLNITKSPIDALLTTLSERNPLRAAGTHSVDQRLQMAEGEE